MQGGWNATRLLLMAWKLNGSKSQCSSSSGLFYALLTSCRRPIATTPPALRLEAQVRSSNFGMGVALIGNDG